MEELIIKQKGMTSLEIAEVTGKEHKNVIRDIRSLLDKGVNELNFELVDYKDKKGEIRPMYNLTPKGCLILASGYDPVLREKIIDRLEEDEQKLAMRQFDVPQSFSDALLLAAKQQKQIEEQQKAIEQKNLAISMQKETIEKQKPKVKLADTITATAESIPVNMLAKFMAQKGYNVGEHRLFKYLRENGYIGRRGNHANVPCQRYIDMGLFEIQESTDGQHTSIVPMVTGKGQLYFINKFTEGKIPIEKAKIWMPKNKKFGAYNYDD